MGIMDYLNPWKALREAQDELQRRRTSQDADIQLISKLHREADDAKLALSQKDIRIKMQKEEIMRLTEQMRNCQPRDPKTGRLIPKAKAGP